MKDVFRAAEELGKALDRIGVDYRIIGGVAVHTHGYERETKDVDIIIDAENHEIVLNNLIGRGYLPKFQGSRKSLRDTARKVGIDVILGGKEKVGRTEVLFPRPGEIPAIPIPQAGQAKTVDLYTLFFLKILSYKTEGDKRLKDFTDVIEILKRKKIPREFRTKLPEDLQPLFDRAWGAAEEAKQDPLEMNLLPVHPDFDEVARLLAEGKITVEQALERLKLPDEEKS